MAEVFLACAKREAGKIPYKGNHLTFTGQMKKLEGKMITVRWVKGDRLYYDGQWYWKPEWLKFKNGIDPNSEEEHL